MTMPPGKNREKSVKKVAAKIAETPTHSYGATGETRISASEFKARCLELMDTVQERHEPIVITKHGVPVARLVAFDDERPQGMVGSMRGSVLWYGDLISPIDVKWDAGS